MLPTPSEPPRPAFALERVVIRSLVVTCDAYRIGGRETFLNCYLGELKRRTNCRVLLVAGDITGKPPADVFDDVIEAGPVSFGTPYGGVAIADQILAKGRPDLVWCQHYDSLDAWLLATRLEAQLLTSFHGPVDTAGRPTRSSDALGMAIALHRSALVTAVSEESRRAIMQMRPSVEVRLLPNRVLVAHEGPRSVKLEFPRFVLLTRQSKLDHIRASVDLFSRWLELAGPAELVVYSGHAGPDAESSARRASWAQLTRRLGRKWLLARPTRLLCLPRIRLLPPTDAPERAVEAADVVLGMGRALLEGVAAGRPSILVGYERVIDLLDDVNFEAFRDSNFSGRGLTPAPLDEVIQRVRQALVEHRQLDAVREIDVSRSWPETERLLDVSGGRRRSQDQRVADKIVGALEHSASEQDFLSAVRPLLTSAEQRSLAALDAVGVLS
jgi:hypothetical protein